MKHDIDSLFLIPWLKTGLENKRAFGVKTQKPLNLLVRPARFERAAYGFEVRICCDNNGL